SFAAYWEWMAGIIRERHPGAIITHKMMWKGMISDLAAPHQQNYRLWSRAVSVTGGDIYPHPYENFTLRWIMDSYRSFGDGKQVWINEHNGAGVEATNPPAPAMPPETYSAWLWQAVGRGAGGVFHWCLMPGLQADNGGWYSFSDATLSPGFWVTSRELQRLRKIEPYLFRTVAEPGEVAILHSWPSLIQQPGKPISGYATSVADALYRAHVPVRFIDEEMLRSGRLDGVKAILLPGSFCLGATDIAVLRQFAARGGLVVAWPKTGDCDELNRPAGPEFQQLFGIRVAGYDAAPMSVDGIFLDLVHHSWTYQKAPIDQKLTTANYRKTPVRIIPGRHLLGALAGTELAGGPLTGFEDLALDQEVNARIEPAGATVMARFPDGRPAVTQNGRFVYVGTTPMAAGKNWQIALRQLLEAAGVTPPGYVRDAGGRPVDHVDLATLNGVGFRLIIVTNHALGRFYDGRPAAGLTIGIRGPANLRLIQLLDTPTEIVPSLKNGYGEIPAAFLPGEAKVFLAVP
ncbi:MAG: beta-galactosidase, partial [Lentisphaeria bacterium]